MAVKALPTGAARLPLVSCIDWQTDALILRDRDLAIERLSCEGKGNHSRKKGVGSWGSVVPCTPTGIIYKDRFVSSVKEKDSGKAEFLTLPEGNDYGFSNLDEVQPCSSERIDTSNPGTSKSVGDRDEIHVLSSGKILEGALMEDMKAPAERTEKRKALGDTAGIQSHPKLQKGGGYRKYGEYGGPNPKRAAVDPDKSDLALIDEKTGKPIKGRGSITKIIRGRPKKVGVKWRMPKIPKRTNKKWASLGETG
ncbi:hypothetical protein Ancab_011138 [Ancistrocladus abbreviatus]